MHSYVHTVCIYVPLDDELLTVQLVNQNHQPEEITYIYDLHMHTYVRLHRNSSTYVCTKHINFTQPH